MSKYIDKWQAVRNLMDAGLEDTKKAVDAIQFMQEDDVQPVVTCEECVWHVDDGCHNCLKLGMLCPDDADFYCKYGKRPKCGTDMREVRK